MYRKIARYGWLPDVPDQRDHLYAPPAAIAAALPAQINLRSHCHPVLDQGQLGSCTAHALAHAIYFDQMKRGEDAPTLPSRLFIYYNQRVIAGTHNQDAGAMLRDGIKSIARQGYCSEDRWPYDLAKVTKKPPGAAYHDAKKQAGLAYRRVPRTLGHLKGCLAEGYPIIVGFTAYESFESPRVTRNGVIPLPAPVESPIGGHTTLAVGYDDARQSFTIMNSWGKRWGERGFGYMPYGYLLDAGLAGDFWVVGSVTKVVTGY
ncbi:MAG: C1 family peptidase [Sulfuricella sp.]|nr:C1 family peptidase [Sulfuricella sp.]